MLSWIALEMARTASGLSANLTLGLISSSSGTELIYTGDGASQNILFRVYKVV